MPAATSVVFVLFLNVQKTDLKMFHILSFWSPKCSYTFLQLNQSETKAVEMSHLSIEDWGSVKGHHQAVASVAHIVKIFNFFKSQFTRLSIKSTAMRALSNVSVTLN